MKAIVVNAGSGLTYGQVVEVLGGSGNIGVGKVSDYSAPLVKIRTEAGTYHEVCGWRLQPYLEPTTREAPPNITINVHPQGGGAEAHVNVHVYQDGTVLTNEEIEIIQQFRTFKEEHKQDLHKAMITAFCQAHGLTLSIS